MTYLQIKSRFFRSSSKVDQFSTLYVMKTTFILTKKNQKNTPSAEQTWVRTEFKTVT